MQAFFIKLILSIVEKLFKSSKPTMQEGKGKGKLEESLQDKLKKEGW